MLELITKKNIRMVHETCGCWETPDTVYLLILLRHIKTHSTEACNISLTKGTRQQEILSRGLLESLKVDLDAYSRYFTTNQKKLSLS